MYEDSPITDESELDFVGDELGIGKGIDPLEALLNLKKTATDVTETFSVRLVDGMEIPWTLRPVSDEEIEEARERHTKLVKRGRGGGKVAELDETAMGDQLIVVATTSPDLNDPRLRTKYRANRPEQILAVALLPGTRQAIVSKIMDLSGYSDELVAVGKS